MLTNILYAGHLEFPSWNIPLTEARHEPLISFSTFQINQDRLEEKAVAPARKDIAEDFPLRGFLICETCKHQLTSSWSKSHTGRRYPYYHCHHRGCPEKGKTIPRDKIESQFADYLSTLVPDRTIFELAEEMFRTTWEKNSSSAAAEARKMKAKAGQIEKDIHGMLGRLVKIQDDTMISAYEERISELKREQASINSQIAALASPARSFDEMFELSLGFLSNPLKIWENGDTEVKKTVLRLVFSEPLKVNRKEGVRTGKTTFPFKALSFMEKSGLTMVRVKGLEPPRHRRQNLNLVRLPIPPHPHGAAQGISRRHMRH